MNLSHPLRGVLPTLDAPALEVLAGTSRPLSGHQVYVLAQAGTARGIRLALARLVSQGVVLADDHPGATLYSANREHLAWPAIETIVGLRSVLLEQLRARIAAWPVSPVHASIFGSAARGEADEASDLDLLLVRPATADEDAWQRQVESLREWVLAVTGNRCQTFEVDEPRFAEHVGARDPLVDAWRRDGLHLAGEPIEMLVRRSRRTSR